jgi:hypothetical protein
MPSPNKDSGGNSRLIPQLRKERESESSKYWSVDERG